MVVTVDANGNAIYINGLKAPGTYTNGSAASTDFFSAVTAVGLTPEFYIGRSLWAAAYTARGDGHHIYASIYDRALTATEVNWLYHEPYAMFYPTLPMGAFRAPVAGAGLSIPIAQYHYMHH
jgi:hypothetical protein